MPFQSVPDTAEAVIKGTYQGRNIANVINFKFSGGYNQTNIDELAGVVDGWVDSTYKDNFNAGVSYVETLVRGLENEIDLFDVANSGAGPGNANETQMPANNTCCISIRSGLTGRSARGRFYGWPFIAEALTSPNVWVSTYPAALVSALESLQSLAAADGWTMVIVSRFTGGAKRGTAVTFDVTGFSSTSNDVDTIRRRLKG